MKILKIAVLMVVAFTTIFFACKKNNSKATSTTEEFTIAAAQNYHKTLETKYGNYDTIKINGKVEKNLKKVDFSKAYIGENENSYFVEVPVSYTQRRVLLKNNSKIPEATLQKIISNSFDRIVIYKDKVSGMISEKIETIIPSIDYLTDGYKNLHENHFQKMVKDFSGYVTYTSWKGQFLSTQSYNQGEVTNNQGLAINSLKTQSSDFLVCDNATLYLLQAWCEDYDEYGNGVNCDWQIVEVPIVICQIVNPTFTPGGQSPMPGLTDPYWEGWPLPQSSSAGCPGTPRLVESPIMWAATSGSNFSVSLYDACFCQGYSWVILEDVNTGTEYSMPITNQNFAAGTCNIEWETHVEIPTNVPNGTYFVKVNLDSDIFYFQLQSYETGTILKRYTVGVLR